MRILALEPYYGGSHRQFLDGWAGRSAHEWTVLTLPPYKWKWRMRHSAVTFASEIRRRVTAGERWDLLFCSDMLNLAELRGLIPDLIGELPTLIYFHENQITYPVQVEKERDFQFGMTNLISAAAADEVWFNSRFHLETFLEAVPRFLNKMPDHRPLELVEQIGRRARVRQPGIACFGGRRPERPDGPLRILWAARWEFDKNPECFFQALAALKEAEVPFRVSVLGESFRETPAVFDWARSEFRRQIEVWGFQNQRADYQRALIRSDVFVSTALHEFFGLSAVEAMVSGAYPLLPARLAYPELLDWTPRSPTSVHLYDGSPEQLARRLKDLAGRLEAGESIWGGTREHCRELGERFCWRGHVPLLDMALEKVGRPAGALDTVGASEAP